MARAGDGPVAMLLRGLRRVPTCRHCADLVCLCRPRAAVPTVPTSRCCADLLHAMALPCRVPLMSCRRTSITAALVMVFVAGPFILTWWMFKYSVLVTILVFRAIIAFCGLAGTELDMWRRAHHTPAAPTAVQVAQRNLEQARREETAAWAELARLEGRPLSSYTAQRNAARARAMSSTSQAAVSDRR